MPHTAKNTIGNKSVKKQLIHNGHETTNQKESPHRGSGRPSGICSDGHYLGSQPGALHLSGISDRFSGLAEHIGSRSVQWSVQPVCRKSIRYFCLAVRLYLLHPKQQSEKAGQGFRLSLPVAFGAAGRFCHAERRVFSGRRRCCVWRGSAP